MVLSAGSFADDLRVVPAKTAEMISEGNAGQAGGCRGTTSFADRDFVLDAQRQRRSFAFLGGEYFAVSVEDEMILEVFADLAVSAAGGDQEMSCGTGGELEVKIEGNGRGVECRPQVG
jgi:hypothetical protein